MKTKALAEPKRRKAFRDKYLAAVLAVAALLVSSLVYAQTDSLKYSPINGYGFKYKRHAVDSVMLIPLSTSPHVPYRMGAIRYRASDSTLQLWTGHQWNSIITGVGNGIDTAFAYDDSTLAIETPNRDYFVKIKGKPSATQLNDSAFIVGHDTITIHGTGGGAILDTTTIYQNLALKLNKTDTTNKWVNDIRRSNDSVYIFKDGSWQFKFKDSLGGGIDTTILTLTPGTSISWDFSSGTFAQVSLSVSGTLNTPTNLFKGATGLLKVIHTTEGTTLTLPGLTETDLNYRSIKNSVTFTTDSSIIQGPERYLKYIRVKPAHPLSALKIGTTNAGSEIQPAVAIDSAKWTTINVGEYYDQDSVLYFSGITSSTQIVYVTETDISNTNFKWSYNAGDVDYVAFVYDGTTLTWSKSDYGTNFVTGPSYEAESVAFFAVNTGLSTTVKNAVNNLVIAAKGIGWSKFAAIWPVVGGTGTKNGYNLTDPTKFNITFNGGWTHSSTGSLADGTTGYADVFTNMDQMRVDGYFGVNDFHFSYYNRTNFSPAPATDYILFYNISGGAIEWDNFDANHFVIPWATSNINVARTGITGLCLITRRASNDAEAYRAGTSIGTVSSSPPASFVSSGMRLNSGMSAYYSPTEFCGGSCGKGLTSSEVTTWTNAWNAFQTALGR